MSKVYPVMLNIAGGLVVVIGGGKVALRKIKSLLEADADLLVVSPMVVDEIKELHANHSLRLITKEFEPSVLNQAKFAFACTNSKEVNRQVYEVAVSQNIFVNVVDQPELSTFFVPSTLRRGLLTISFSTSAASPAISKYLREQLESKFTQSWEPFLELLAAARKKILSSQLSDEERRAKLLSISDKRLVDLVFASKLEQVKSIIAKIVD
ncbi:MAG: precorrin-2 dehydrogenase/sirohydrochlorin ferrochelatase family protein [Nitrospinota bacterium]